MKYYYSKKIFQEIKFILRQTIELFPLGNRNILNNLHQQLLKESSEVNRKNRTFILNFSDKTLRTQERKFLKTNQH